MIDDRVAFVGGLDFTRGRWDTPEHRPDDARRADVPGTHPQPYHDVQMMVDGPAAAALGELARERWRLATGRTLAAPEPPPGSDPWPGAFEPELSDVPVAIARTVPVHDGQPEVREIESLFLDAIGLARECLYVENQYLTSRRIGEALAARLEEDDGPEVVLVLPERTDGWLSRYTMDVMRMRLLREVSERDRHGRLRLYCPEIPGLGEQCVNVHAKVLIADEQLLVVGSANLNNRSMGLDTECNLAIEARDDARLQKGIAVLRDRLLSEHLGCDRSEIAEAIEAKGSLIAAIDSLNRNARRLEPLNVELDRELDTLVPQTELADPESAIDADYLARQLVSPEDRKPARAALIGFASVLVAALLLAASWRWTPLGEWLDVRALFEGLSSLRGGWLGPLLVIGLFTLGGLLMVPVTLMIIATGLAFGAMYGFFYALAGSVVSAVVTYGIGHWLGHETVRKISHRWLARANRYLARQGLLAIITLRIVPVAPFTVINLLAGASHLRMRQFALGTLIGMLPGVFALTLLSDQVVAAIRSPEATRIAVLAVLAALIALGSWALTRWLTGRGKNVSRRAPE